jgi:hypothetical protein
MPQTKHTPRKGGRETRSQHRQPDHRTLQRRAQRIIQATGYPASIRRGLSKALGNPAKLRMHMEAIEESRREINQIAVGADVFAGRAFALAYKFFFKHCDDGDALIRFIDQMEGGAK